MPRSVPWFFLGLSMLAASVEVGHAEECFGGVSCEQVALAAASFKLARDCPSVFQIAPDKADEFKKVMYALRHRPMAGVFPDEFSDTPEPRPAKECKDAAKAVAQGKVPGLYVMVRTKMAKSPGK